ncbi:hypothetical protein B0H13DRAFT_2511048, partial [Mycena leptocephala]
CPQSRTRGPASGSRAPQLHHDRGSPGRTSIITAGPRALPACCWAHAAMSPWTRVLYALVGSTEEAQKCFRSHFLEGGCARGAHGCPPSPAFSFPGPGVRVLWIDAVQARTRTRIGGRDTTLYDASDDTHSHAHLVPIDVDVKGRGSDGRAVRVGHGAYILLLLCSPVIALTLAFVILTIALAAAAAILKHDRLRLSAVDGCAPVSVALRDITIPNTSARLPSMRILLRKQAPRSSATDSGFEPLQYANVREVDVGLEAGWCEIAPTAQSASAEGPACAVGSARSELRRIWTQSAPASASAYGWIRHTALGVDAHSRALLEMQMENARGCGLPRM